MPLNILKDKKMQMCSGLEHGRIMINVKRVLSVPSCVYVKVELSVQLTVRAGIDKWGQRRDQFIAL